MHERKQGHAEDVRISHTRISSLVTYADSAYNSSMVDVARSSCSLCFCKKISPELFLSSSSG